MSARGSHLLTALIAAMAFLVAASLLLPGGGSGWAATAGDFLLDRGRAGYPFTIQNVMWLVFFVTLAELLWRLREANREQHETVRGLLPEDPTVVLRKVDLAPVYRELKSRNSGEDRFLQRIARRCVRQFQTSGSIADASNVFNASMELFQHELDLRYNMARYLIWVIPTLGFIGTVLGIILALNGTAAFAAAAQSDPAVSIQDPGLLISLTDKLGVAFYTTLLALLMSALLVLVMHFVQEREERALNRVGQYCMDNLVNRLYEDRR
jgi:biopolymer transport protein ExbB/TolQ